MESLAHLFCTDETARQVPFNITAVPSGQAAFEVFCDLRFAQMLVHDLYYYIVTTRAKRDIHRRECWKLVRVTTPAGVAVGGPDCVADGCRRP